MAMRTTSSNSTVVSKTTQAAPLQKMKAKPVSKPETARMLSDEDDSLEREVAMSSPMKGEEYRKSVQVRFHFLSVEYTLHCS